MEIGEVTFPSPVALVVCPDFLSQSQVRQQILGAYYIPIFSLL